MSMLVPGDGRPRLLAVFAHPDDECFCAGGTLARYAEAGAELLVISATRGDAGQIHDTRVATRRTLGAVREQELQQACRQLGVQQAMCLDYGDGTLSAIDQGLLERDIVRVIRAFRPDAVITFGEDGAYGHPDHIAIGRATTTACAWAGDGAYFAEQVAEGLAPHHPTYLYHNHFPRSRTLLMERLVEWLVAKEERFQGNADFARGLQLLAEETTTLGYTEDHIDVHWYPAGVAIVEQGEPATKLYLILSGEVEVRSEEADGQLRSLARLGQGAFFGEQGLALGKPRNAHVVALDHVTCLTFSPAPPTAYSGRGGQARPELALSREPAEETGRLGVTTCVDVTAFVEHKMRAIACHRTQYPIEPDMFPLPMLQDVMGREYFVRVPMERVRAQRHSAGRQCGNSTRAAAILARAMRAPLAAAG
jgi:LmbE family N-acetylglucosaminyl deacetylase